MKRYRKKPVVIESSRPVTFTFSASAYAGLQALARGGSLADALRDAIALATWFEEVVDDADTRLILVKDGAWREIIGPTRPLESWRV